MTQNWAPGHEWKSPKQWKFIAFWAHVFRENAPKRDPFSGPIQGQPAGPFDYFPVLVKDLPVVDTTGLIYTYEIIEDAYWDDGTPFSVDDVIFSTKLQICPLTNNSQIRPIYSSVIEKVVKDSMNKFKFHVYVKKVDITAKSIYSEIYMQQKRIRS